MLHVHLSSLCLRDCKMSANTTAIYGFWCLNMGEISGGRPHSPWNETGRKGAWFSIKMNKKKKDGHSTNSKSKPFWRRDMHTTNVKRKSFFQSPRMFQHLLGYPEKRKYFRSKLDGRCLGQTYMFKLVKTVLQRCNQYEWIQNSPLDKGIFPKPSIWQKEQAMNKKKTSKTLIFG